MTFYTEVTSFTIMEHLRKISGGRYIIDAVDIMSDMKHYFDEASSIPVYINMMDTAQKNYDRAKLPIYDNMLVAIATKAILAYDRFPHTNDAWEEKNDVYKTWSEWKETYLAAHNSREKRLRVAGDVGGHNFGTANAATTPTSDRQVTFQYRPHTIPYETLERLYSYLTNVSDAIVNAATAGSLYAADISSMAKIFDTLTLANATLVKEVASL